MARSVRRSSHDLVESITLYGMQLYLTVKGRKHRRDSAVGAENCYLPDVSKINSPLAPAYVKVQSSESIPYLGTLGTCRSRGSNVAFIARCD